MQKKFTRVFSHINAHQKIKTLGVVLAFFYVQEVSANPFENALSGMSTFLRGAVGIAIAAIIGAVLGYRIMAGKLDKGWLLGYFAGLVLLFEAPEIVTWLKGLAQGGT